MRVRLVRIIDEADEPVSVGMCWNQSNPDKQPLDFEDFRVQAADGRRALAAFDAGDMAGFEAILEEMSAKAGKAVADGRRALAAFDAGDMAGFEAILEEMSAKAGKAVADGQQALEGEGLA
jgi:hypothetical protein